MQRRSSIFSVSFAALICSHTVRIRVGADKRPTWEAGPLTEVLRWFKVLATHSTRQFTIRDFERTMHPASSARLEWGIVQHYVADAGFGFLRHEEDPSEVNNVYFHITSCDVQSPPPRVGELVLFSKDGSSPRAAVTTVRRVALTQDEAPGEGMPPSARSALDPSEPSPLHEDRCRSPSRTDPPTTRDSAPAAR